MKKQVAITIISVLLMLLFVYASFSKLFLFGMFIRQMKNQVFPLWMVPILTVAIPGVELITTVCLMVDKWRRAGLISSIVLMSLFTGYIAIVMTNIFGRIPCSCGGILQKMGWGQHLVFNIFFLVLAIAGLIIDKRQKNSSPNYGQRTVITA